MGTVGRFDQVAIGHPRIKSRFPRGTDAGDCLCRCMQPLRLRRLDRSSALFMALPEAPIASAGICGRMFFAGMFRAYIHPIQSIQLAGDKQR